MVDLDVLAQELGRLPLLLTLWSGGGGQVPLLAGPELGHPPRQLGKHVALLDGVVRLQVRDEV